MTNLLRSRGIWVAALLVVVMYVRPRGLLGRR